MVARHQVGYGGCDPPYACYNRNEAMARAYLTGRHTMAAIAQHFDVHYATVSRAVNAYKSTPEA